MEAGPFTASETRFTNSYAINFFFIHYCYHPPRRDIPSLPFPFLSSLSQIIIISILPSKMSRSSMSPTEENSNTSSNNNNNPPTSTRGRRRSHHACLTCRLANQTHTAMSCRVCHSCTDLRNPDERRPVAQARSQHAPAASASNSHAPIPRQSGPPRAVLRYVVHGVLHTQKNNKKNIT